jgi:putative SOS response-associated peptidase YedK
MCIFFDQHGNIRHRYPTYGVSETIPFQVEPRIRPNQLVNVIVPGPVGPENQRANWGFRTGRFDWNTRDDRLASSPLWKTMWMQRGHHVVVPMSHAYEATKRFGTRRWFAVRRHDEEPLWVPALGRVQEGPHRVEWHVSVVTVDAGPVFTPIHDTPREIVCLRTWDEAQTWLKADDERSVRALLRPAGPDLLTAYRVHDDVFKESFDSKDCAKPYAERPQGLDRFGVGT